MIGDITGLVTPYATWVFEVTDEFLLFCVDTNDRFLPSGKVFPHATDMAKLQIPFGAPLERAVAAEGDPLAIGLKRISQFLEHTTDPLIADHNAFPLEFIGDFSGRLAGPFQAGYRVTRSFVFHKRADAMNDLWGFF